MEQTMEWNIICRICLQEGEMRSIFENDDDNLRICDKIMCCSNIKIHKSANFPDNICAKCLKYLRIAYEFRKNCENSDTILQSFTRSNQLIINGMVLPDNLVIRRIPLKTNNLSSSQNITERKPNHSKNDIKIEKCNINIELDQQCNNDDSQNSNSNFIHNENSIEIISKSDGNDLEEEGSVYVDYQDNNGNNFINYVVKSEERYVISEETIEVLLSDEEQTNESRQKETKLSKTNSKNKMKNTSKQSKKSHICELCGNIYKKRHALDIHMRRHRNEKPFTCEICNKGFVLNVELKSHMRTHTGQKPYGCKFCGRHFSDFGSRVKHERIHTGERPYVCGTCGKGFAYSYGLNSHILTHTGEKPHECPKCGRRFSKKHHLKHHLKVHMKSEAAALRKKEVLRITITSEDDNLKKKNILNENNENIEIMEEYIGDGGSENIIENNEEVDDEIVEEIYYLRDDDMEES